MKCILSILLIYLTGSFGLKILGIFPYEGKSHFFVFQALLRELAERGHNVTVISYFPEQNPAKNYHEVILKLTRSPVEGSVSISNLNVLNVGMYIAETGISNCEIMLQDDRVKNIASQKFDVVLMEKFNSDCAHGLAYKIGAPVVGISCHIPMPFHYSPIGIPYNPAYVTFHFSGGGTKPTLFQRVERTVLGWYFKILFAYVTYQNEVSISKHLGDVPPLSELASQTKFLLLYHNFVLTGSAAFPSNVIEVGGFHVGKPKQLPVDLKKFMDGAEHGVIYISFGSTVKPSTLSLDKKKVILDTIEALPQKFIWKWDDESLPIDRRKVFIGKWLPQADILAHPKTVAFLSHGGMLGTTEAVHYGVPIVAMPLFGDQPANAAAIEESGFGVQISLSDLSQERLVAAFKTVLQPEFRARAQVVSKAWHSRPMAPLDTAIFWVEYAAQFPELNFTSPLAFVPLYQERNWDIIAVFTVPLVLLYLILKIISWRKKTKVSVPKKKRKTK